jgi:signal transduction histidine kinase/ActR/RegA family two-component response regulator
MPQGHPGGTMIEAAGWASRSAVPPLVCAFAAVSMGAALSILAEHYGHGNPVIRPCAAILMVFVMCWPRVTLPPYLLAALAAEWGTMTWLGDPAGGLIDGLGDVAEVALFAEIYGLFWQRSASFERIARLFIGLTLAAGIALAVGAVIVALLHLLLHGLPFARMWEYRFVSDSVGVMVLTPQMIVIWHGGLLRAPQRRVLLKTALFLVLGVLLSLLAFYESQLPVRLVLFSFLVLVTFRLPPTGTFAVMLAVSLSAVIFTLLAGASDAPQVLTFQQSLTVVQLFIAAVVLTITPVGIVLHQRDSLAVEAKLALREAERANRSKSDYLAAMSHEIRTPANGIIGFTELLSETALTAEQAHQINLIQESGRSLLAIINDILDIASAERGLIALNPGPFQLSVLMEAVRSFVANQARTKGLVLSLEMSPDIPAWVEGDAPRLRQTLLNLLTNAIKFANQGRVSLQVLRDEHDPPLYHFAVIDTGIGLTAEQQASLFNPFVRLDNHATRQVPGTGLGLAISKSLIEAMPGGRVGVTSQLGVGSTFWFDVELPECDAPPELGDKMPIDAQTGPALDILVAEDYPVNQMIIEAMLKRAGHNVTVVEDGLKAVEAVSRLRFDLVLMDMEMPVMKGVEATRAIRNLAGEGRDVPIVALTANAMPKEIAACLEAGMNSHLSKPLNKAALQQELARWTGGGVRTEVPPG